MRARVNANGVRLYEHNSTLSAAKGFIAYGDEIEISAEYGDWCQLADGRWVEACYTEAIEVGGGGVTSWNDLTDKPFGEEEFFDTVFEVYNPEPEHKEVLKKYVLKNVQSYLPVGSLGGVVVELNVDGLVHRFENENDGWIECTIEDGRSFYIRPTGPSEYEISWSDDQVSPNYISMYFLATRSIPIGITYLPMLVFAKVGDGQFMPNLPYNEAYNRMLEMMILGGGCLDGMTQSFYPFYKIALVDGDYGTAIECLYKDEYGDVRITFDAYEVRGTSL